MLNIEKLIEYGNKLADKCENLKASLHLKVLKIEEKNLKILEMEKELDELRTFKKLIDMTDVKNMFERYEKILK